MVMNLAHDGCDETPIHNQSSLGTSHLFFVFFFNSVSVSSWPCIHNSVSEGAEFGKVFQKEKAFPFGVGNKARQEESSGPVFGDQTLPLKGKQGLAQLGFQRYQE